MRRRRSGLPSHDPTCALCPGVKRLNGTTNPLYTGAWWFPQRPAVLRRQSGGTR
ncbi:MAG: hypothetical protein WDM96_03295 [Lacunisphaera sp.]